MSIQDPGKTKAIVISSKKKKSSSSSSYDFDFIQEIVAKPKLINDFIVTFKSMNYQNTDFNHDNADVMETIKKISLERKGNFCITLFDLKPLFEETKYYLFCLDKYFNVPLEVHNQVRLLGKFQNNQIMLENKKNPELFDFAENQVLIIDPTTMISPTQINGRQYCHRAQMLKTVFACYETAEPMLIGIACHEFFEHFLQYKNPLNNQEISLIEASLKLQEIQLDMFSKRITDLIQKIYRSNLQSAYQLNLSYEVFVQKIIRMCLGGLKWIDTYVYRQTPLELEQNKFSNAFQPQRSIQILEVVEVEKFLECSEFGFNGKLDAIVKCLFREIGKPSFEQLIPFEIKTGKPSESYKYQTIIYSILMKKFYQLDYFPSGLLYYMGDNQIIEVKPLYMYVDQVFFERNFIAQQLRLIKDHGKLPSIVNKQYCEYCQLKNACITTFLINTDIEDQEPQFPGYEEVKSKLKKKEIDYYKKQMRLISLEEKSSITEMNHVFQSNNKSNILSWIENILFAGLQKNCSIELCSQSCLEQQAQILSLQFQIGDEVHISNDDIQIKIVSKVEATSTKSLDSEGNYIFILNLDCKPPKMYLQKIYDLIINYRFTTLVWTAKKKDYNPFPIMKNAILDIVLNENQENLRNVIVNGVYLETSERTEEQSLALNYLDSLFKEKLNSGQYEAIKKSILCDTFHIILGYPGTGKTFVIVHLIYLLALVGFRVLVLSYTHSALDNILDQFARIFATSLDTCVRFGNDKERMSAIAKEISFDITKFPDVSYIKNFLFTKMLFFTTCLSCNDRILKMQEFDYCIVDEASQIIEPLCVSNIMNGKRFVLIGDYLQLQPLVRNNEAKQSLQISLLERLANQFPSHTEKLTVQFRMNADIMKLSNMIIYGNQLKITNELQLKQKLQLNSNYKEKENCEYVKHLLDPENSVIFINYQKLVDQESCEQIEVDLVKVIVNKLLSYNIQVDDFAVITTYNRQLYRLMKEFPQMLNIKLLSIDRSQGIDKDCIIVVCSQNSNESHLLQNKRRINVAFTRAKKKLIVVGNEQYLSSFDSIKSFLSLMRQSGWIQDLERMMK